MSNAAEKPRLVKLAHTLGNLVMIVISPGHINGYMRAMVAEKNAPFPKTILNSLRCTRPNINLVWFIFSAILVLLLSGDFKLFFNS